MDCTSCQEKIVEILSFPSLTDAPERMTDELLEHTSVCIRCRRELDETLQAFAVLPLGLGKVTPPEGFANSIIDRLKERSEARTATSMAPLPSNSDPDRPSPSIQHRWIFYALAAGVLCSIVGGQWLYLRRVEAIARASRDPSEQEQLRSTERAISEMNRLQRQAADPRLRFASVTREHARASGVLNVDSGDLHFHGLGLDPLGSGETYAIWLITKNATRLVRAFQPSADRSVNFVATIESLKVRQPSQPSQPSSYTLGHD